MVKGNQKVSKRLSSIIDKYGELQEEGA